MPRFFKTILLLALVCYCVGAKAQTYAVPDTNFRNKLINLGYVSSMNAARDSIYPTAAVLGTTSLTLDYSNLKSIKGIQAFTGLTELSCKHNQLITLPILPSKIKTLYVDYNSISSIPALPDSILDFSCSINLLTSLPVLPNNLRRLTCIVNSLATLPTLPDSIREIYCGGNNLTALPTLPNYLFSLYCENNNLTALPALPGNLFYLGCNNANLTSLPALPNSLYSLNCEQNAITTLPALPFGLSGLACNSNLLTSLPALPVTLSFLACGDNNLGVLPALPNSLHYLDCRHTSLTALPPVPPYLRELYCVNNLLTALPTLPTYMTDLDCSKNLLTFLPAIPATTLNLTCSHNALTALPPLPSNLRRLVCDSNSMTVLPSLPNTVSFLECSHNLLSTLPVLNDSLKQLFCNYNQLIGLPTFPDSLTELRCDHNNIICLPPITTNLATIWVDSSDVHCVPNISNAIISNAGVGSLNLPLCWSPASSCPVAWNIAGRVFYDSIVNCAKDASERTFSDIKVSLFKNGVFLQQTLTNSNGEYSFLANSNDTFTIVVDTAQHGFSPSCAQFRSLTSIISLAHPLDTGMNFGVRCSGTGVNDKVAYGTITAAGRYFPGDFVTVVPMAGQFGYCNPNTSGRVSLYISGNASFLILTPTTLPPYFISMDSVIWMISDFNQINFENSFNMIAMIDTSAQSGDQICYTLKLSSFYPDATPANNISQSCFTVDNSFDPNDKKVQPSGDISPNNEWLTYTVRFQNTGTAAARNIMITDTIDQNLQIGTFELLSYSHKPGININADRVVKFSFKSINLPDSGSDEQGSHGYVTYRLKQNPNMPIGTVIRNTAYIYFDYNSPVITNTTVSTVNNVTAVSNTAGERPALAIYPNPTNNNVIVLANDVSYDHATARMLDVVGKEVDRKMLKPGQATIFDVSNMQPGVYLLIVETTSGDKIVRKITRL